jgi:hypothetical protein
MKKTIILLSGAKRSGKDTVGQMIFDQLLASFNFYPIKTSFAAKLKEASATLANIIYNTDCFKVEHFSDESVRQGDYPFIKGAWAGKQICLRTVLQDFGTEVCRKCIDHSIWIDTVVKFIKTNVNNYVFIITDMRFPNEINKITKKFKNTYNILSILIKRQGLESTDTHESESFFQQMEQEGLYTDIIENNGTLDDLKQKTDLFVEKNV